MKKITTKTILAVLLIVAGFQSCIKDTVTQQYTFFKPVYKTRETVINNIKSATPQAIIQTGKFFLKDNYVFLNDVNRGVHIIDYTNPAAPVKVAYVDIPGNIDIAVRGNILYADCYTSLIALDISNPLDVKKTKVINGVFPHRVYYNFQQDTSLIITEWIRVDTTVTSKHNINTSKNFDGIFIQSFSGGSISSAVTNGIGGSMARFGLLNDRMYAVSYSDIKVFNTFIPANPNFVNTISAGVNDIETIFPFGTNLFLGSNTGMHIFNAANPDQPVKTGVFAHARVCDPVIADQNYAYVTLRSGSTCQGFTNQLDIVNISNMSNPTLLKSYPLKNPHGLCKDGNTLFICDGADGLKIFDATNTASITLLKTVGNIETYDVIAQNGYALVVAKNGLHCVDYRNMNNIKLISTITITGK